MGENNQVREEPEVLKFQKQHMQVQNENHKK